MGRPPLHSGNARKKTFFLIDVFPYDDYESEYDYHDGDGDHYGDEICVNKVEQGR